jgi:hypothetical protein
MRRLYLIFSVFCILNVSTTVLFATTNETISLSPEAQISLLTTSPSDDDIYTLYGHTALRVLDTVSKIDVIFNYGIFDFSKPNFLYRFAKGETDYKLEVSDFRYYLLGYTMRGSEVYEQVLNLLPEEKESLWQALVLNTLPENKVYRYNFFFDNCATRPIAMVEKSIHGTVKYAPSKNNRSFRDAINYCTRYQPWQTFGCDLIMGIPTDRRMTLKESFFIPAYLKEAAGKAEIVRDDTTVPLVSNVNILNEEVIKEPSPLFITSPLACFGLFFIIVLIITWSEYRKLTHYILFDCALFFVAGIAGCIMFFLSFLSVHPGMFPNISLLWLHPLHFIGVLFFLAKKLNNMAYWYHFINFAAILLMSVAWIFIPQHFNIAFIPLIASLWLRSGWVLLRKRNSIG